METVGLRAKHLPYPVCLQRGSSFLIILLEEVRFLIRGTQATD